MKQELLQLIIDRKTSIERVLNLLGINWGKINWAANRGNEDLTTGLIPKRGFLDKERKIRYNFHGAGICVDFEDEVVNFDFNFKSAEFSDEDQSGLNHWDVIGYFDDHKRKYTELENLLSNEKIPYEEKLQMIRSLLENLKTEGNLYYDKTKDRYFLA